MSESSYYECCGNFGTHTQRCARNKSDANSSQLGKEPMTGSLLSHTEAEALIARAEREMQNDRMASHQLARDLLTLVRAQAQELQEWQHHHMADTSGHMLRCAKQRHALDPPIKCVGSCNPFVAECGARFCSYEELAEHNCIELDAEHIALLKAQLQQRTEERR